jgi:hypothetical protein
VEGDLILLPTETDWHRQVKCILQGISIMIHFRLADASGILARGLQYLGFLQYINGIHAGSVEDSVADGEQASQ